MKALVSLGLGVALALAAPTVCRADVIRSDVPVNGLSQAELSARWWQWAVSYPDGANPVQDTTGALSYLGADQTAAAHPGIFFLAGSFTSDPVTRSVTVGSDQFLFFPLTNAISAIPFFGSTEAEIRQDAADDMGVVSNLSLTLNGNPLPLPPPTTSLLDYRQQSPPGLFDLTLPGNNIFGAPPGTYPAVSDGYWVALGPLDPGNYQLRFTSRSEGTGAYAGDVFTQDITYNITVAAVPEPTSLLLFGVGAVGACRFGLARRRRAQSSRPATGSAA